MAFVKTIRVEKNTHLAFLYALQQWLRTYEDLGRAWRQPLILAIRENSNGNITIETFSLLDIPQVQCTMLVVYGLRTSKNLWTDEFLNASEMPKLSVGLTNKFLGAVCTYPQR